MSRSTPSLRHSTLLTDAIRCRFRFSCECGPGATARIRTECCWLEEIVVSISAAEQIATEFGNNKTRRNTYFASSCRMARTSLCAKRIVKATSAVEKLRESPSLTSAAVPRKPQRTTIDVAIIAIATVRNPTATKFSEATVLRFQLDLPLSFVIDSGACPT